VNDSESKRVSRRSPGGGVARSGQTMGSATAHSLAGAGVVSGVAIARLFRPTRAGWRLTPRYRLTGRAKHALSDSEARCVSRTIDDATVHSLAAADIVSRRGNCQTVLPYSPSSGGRWTMARQANYLLRKTTQPGYQTTNRRRICFPRRAKPRIHPCCRLPQSMWWRPAKSRSKSRKSRTPEVRDG
jgi:hypothetical protein